MLHKESCYKTFIIRLSLNLHIWYKETIKYHPMQYYIKNLLYKKVTSIAIKLNINSSMNCIKDKTNF